MAKVIMICGKICCGKSTYARQLRLKEKAVILSIDEIMLSIFGQYAGEKHDEYSEGTQKYLLNKSLEFIKAGINIILDWGFWTKEKRDFAREFYSARNISCEFHYLDISDETWKARIQKRNAAVFAGETVDYFVDENLLAKAKALFETPDKNEIDVWVKDQIPKTLQPS